MKNEEVTEDVKEEIKESVQDNNVAGVDDAQTEVNQEENSHIEGVDTSYLEKIVSQILEQQNKMQEQLKNVANAQSIIIDAGGVIRETNQENEDNTSALNQTSNNVLSFDNLDLTI